MGGVCSNHHTGQAILEVHCIDLLFCVAATSTNKHNKNLKRKISRNQLKSLSSENEYLKLLHV